MRDEVKNYVSFAWCRFRRYPHVFHAFTCTQLCTQKTIAACAIGNSPSTGSPKLFTISHPFTYALRSSIQGLLERRSSATLRESPTRAPVHPFLHREGKTALRKGGTRILG